MKGKEKFKITGNIYIKNIKSKLEISVDNQKKYLKIDNNNITKTSEYISKMNLIIFYPDDLELIKNSPNIRRNFLNLELSQLYSNYYILINEYNKILKMRNDYLKISKNFDLNYFEIITNFLIEKSIQIYRIRNKFIIKLNKNVEKIFKSLTNIEKFNILYKNSLNFNNYEKDYLKEILKNEFKKIIKKEIKYKMTLIGPHRDDLEFYIDNQNLKEYGSQGQQRMAVLATKLAEIEIFKEIKDTTPILLLDDVFSELDKNKKNNLIKFINNNMQVIITTTDLSNINKKLLKNSKLIQIEAGNIKKIKEVE